MTNKCREVEDDSFAREDIQLARGFPGKDADGHVLKDNAFESGHCWRVVVESVGQVPTLDEIPHKRTTCYVMQNGRQSIVKKHNLLRVWSDDL